MEHMEHTVNFEELYHEYYPKVFRHIAGKIGNFHEAEDLAQEVFVSCYKNFDKYDPEKAKAGTWIYVIMNNRLKNYYRDKKETVSLDDEDCFIEPAGEDFVEAAILLEEQTREVLNAIARLSEREQEIVKKRYFYGKKSAEIAESLRMTDSNVRVTLNRALIKLRTYLLESGYQEG